jgi:hypothetical protein
MASHREYSVHPWASPLRDQRRHKTLPGFELYYVGRRCLPWDRLSGLAAERIDLGARNRGVGDSMREPAKQARMQKNSGKGRVVSGAAGAASSPYSRPATPATSGWLSSDPKHFS